MLGLINSSFVLPILPAAHKLARVLSNVEILPVVTVTVFPEPSNRTIQGFGVLFSKISKMKALGVLFNEFIFPRGFSRPAETWILGGAAQLDLVNTADSEILNLIQSDRSRLLGVNATIKDFRITRWEKAFPHYTVELERQLQELKEFEAELPRFYLHGNYLGKLGLTRILDRSEELALLLATEDSQS